METMQRHRYHDDEPHRVYCFMQPATQSWRTNSLDCGSAASSFPFTFQGAKQELMAIGANSLDSPMKPKAKRPRVEDLGSPGDRLTRTSRSELWFDDGNIVLAVGGTAFRVYKGLLSKSSTILAGMLSAPRSAFAEKFEGCDVIRLRGDEPADVARVLELIFCGPE